MKPRARHSTFDSISAALDAIRYGDPSLAFEASKYLINTRVRTDSLTAIALDQKRDKTNRVAAISTLAFLGRKNSVPALIAIVADKKEPMKIRGEAAEAVGYARDKRPIPLFRKIIMSGEKPGLKAECIFALARIGGSESLAVLREFERTKPAGEVAAQLKEALADIKNGIM
ncbi:MAG TPA: HEAT repeat domain-containing protein [Candidatus Binataceae bacterium]|nr:HEAT repeat domain-containing protein [Candidatus Binataceae bacterium]